MNLGALLILLVVYQVKHFLADYPLQTKVMLGKFRPGWNFVGPLAAHAAVHALFTLLIADAFLGAAGLDSLVPPLLAIFDFVVHFTMDRVKASPRWLGRFKPLSPGEYRANESITKMNGGAEIDLARVLARVRLRSNTYYWWALGFDQMAHHLTHYAIIYVLVTR